MNDFVLRNESLMFVEQAQATVSPAITMATMLISLIRILRLGPEVSLNGSPTVSPTTVALCTSAAFAAEIAFLDILLGIVPRTAGIRHKDTSTNPLLSPPISSPNTPGTPKTSPVRMGAMIAISEELPFRVARLSWRWLHNVHNRVRPHL